MIARESFCERQKRGGHSLCMYVQVRAPEFLSARLMQRSTRNLCKRADPPWKMLDTHYQSICLISVCHNLSPIREQLVGVVMEPLALVYIFQQDHEEENISGGERYLDVKLVR